MSGLDDSVGYEGLAWLVVAGLVGKASTARTPRVLAPTTATAKQPQPSSDNEHQATRQQDLCKQETPPPGAPLAENKIPSPSTPPISMLFKRNVVQVVCLIMIVVTCFFFEAASS